MQIRKKLRSLEGLLQFRGNEEEISHTAHKLSVGAFALQSALDKVRRLRKQMSQYGTAVVVMGNCRAHI